MKKLNKKAIIIIICAILIIAAIAVAAILLSRDSSDEEGTAVNPKVISIDEKRELMADFILPWDSSEQEHYYFHEDIPSLGKKCSLKVDSDYYLYDDIEEAWVDANTTYKNQGDLTLTLYEDWVADENGSFGTDTAAFLDGGLLIKGWEKDVTINLNGFKLDRNLNGETQTNGFVIKVDGSYKADVYIKNGYITGGGNTNDGGGVLIYGNGAVSLDNVTVTGNVSGRDGGGVYLGSYAQVSFEDVIIEGNYAENYGGGAYADYNAGATKYNIEEMYGVVKIQNNEGVNGRDNLTLEFANGGVSYCPYIAFVSLTDGSSIYVSMSQEKSNERIFIMDDDYDVKSHKYFYADENWQLVTVHYGFDRLGIKKK